MKNLPFLARIATWCLPILALSLSSCVYYDTDPGHGSYRRSYSTYGGSSYGYSPFNSYGSGYHRSGYCNVCRSYSCRGHHGHSRYDHHHEHRNEYHRDRSSHDRKKSDSKHRDNAYRIVSGSTGSKKKPTGYHSPEWFESRGYDTSRLRLENERGETYRSSSSSSRRSSSSARSSSSGSSSKRSSGSSTRSSSGSNSYRSSGGNAPFFFQQFRKLSGFHDGQCRQFVYDFC